jgi:beta-lactamase family protein
MRSWLGAFAVSILAVAAIGGVAAHPAARGRAHWQPAVRAAKRYARGRAGEIGFAVVGLDGREHGINARMTAPAASVFKVMLLAAYLRRPSVRHRSLDGADRRLLGPMIRVSDSVAATRVRDIVGVAAIERLARAARMRAFRYNPIWGLSRIDAADQARFIYHLGRYIPRRHRRYARHLLSSITPSQRWGVGRVRPRGWRLYFKGGWASGTGRVDHQVALLERHGQRVSLAILTQFDPSHDYGKRTLRGVARRLLRGLSNGRRRVTPRSSTQPTASAGPKRSEPSRPLSSPSAAADAASEPSTA